MQNKKKQGKIGLLGMNKNHFGIAIVFSVILALFIILALAQIKSPPSTSSPSPTPTENVITPTLTPQETGEDVNLGTFKGTLPCADCSGLVTELTLVRSEPYSGDGTYILKQTYVDKGPPIESKGDWTTLRGTQDNPDATVYQLDPGKPSTSQYFLVVSPNEIKMLDKNRNTINSSFNYVLSRATTASNELEDTSWVWTETDDGDGRTTKPKKPGSFVVLFEPKGKLSVQTDCNSYFGTYTVSDENITIDASGSTLMYCEGSQENEFISQLNQAQRYTFKGEELILWLKYDYMTMTFRPQQ